MKNKLIIYSIILIVLIAGYTVLTRLPKKSDDTVAAEFRILEGIEANSIEIENTFGNYTVSYDYPDWTMNGKKVNSGYIASLLNIKSSLKLQSDDLKAFGLESPASRVTVIGKNGEKTLFIGDLTSDKNGRYVKSDGIYVVSTEYTEWLLESGDILKNHLLYSEANPKKVEFNGICFEIIGDTWQMTSPYRHGVRGTELNSEVLEKLHFEAIDFTEKSKEECGLDKPEQYLSVWNENNEKTTIYFGDASDGLIYAMIDGGNEICRIEKPSFLDKDAVFFLNKLCYVKNIDEIDGIELNNMLFTISDGKYKKDGRLIEKSKFTEFYKQLMGMTLVDEAVNPEKNELVLKMTVKFKNKSVDTVEVYKHKERYGAVFVNGECSFYTLLESAEKIITDANNL